MDIFLSPSATRLCGELRHVMGLTTNCYITRYNEIQLRGPGECNRQTKRADYGLSSHENKCESREIILFCVDTYISGKPWKTINVII